MRDDPRVIFARERGIMKVAADLRIEGLRRSSKEWVAPCPVCGGKRDRLQIQDEKGVFFCRGEDTGGDVIALVQHVLRLDFKGAVGWLVGDAQVEMSQAEIDRLKKEREQKDAARRARADRERGRAIRQARDIWASCSAADGTAVSAYLRLRGLPAWIADRPPSGLRFHPALPYMVPAGDGRAYVEIHRGPAMVAGCLDVRGELTAVHRTWLDLTRAKGKARIMHEGAEQPAKKIWGAKKGTSIRLTHVRDASFDTLVMGEGIETTLTARAADSYANAAYWAGVDLGNMSGQRIIRGDGMKFAGIPDLHDAEAFLPPHWVAWLVFVQDGDSDPQLTRAKLLAGLRRARAKSRRLKRISIVHPGEGRDLNDLIMEDVGNAA